MIERVSGDSDLFTNATNESFKSMYTSRYGHPKSSEEAISTLCKAYEELVREISPEVESGIGEYYRILTTRGLPAFEWMLEAFNVTSKKEDNKRNFPYVVGMLRQWMKFGFGHIPSQEEDDIINYFEEVTGVEISYKSRQLIQNLMGRYGVIKVTIMLNNLREGIDFSYIAAEHLSQMLENKYGSKW